jgi:hypothetical protein
MSEEAHLRYLNFKLLLGETIDTLEDNLASNISEVRRRRILRRIDGYFHAFELCRSMVRMYRAQRDLLRKLGLFLPLREQITTRRTRIDSRWEVMEVERSFEAAKENATMFVDVYHTIHNLRLGQKLRPLYGDWRAFLDGE